MAEFARLAGMVEDVADSNPQLGQKAHAALGQLRSASKALAHMSQMFSESYLDLTAIGVHDSRRAANREYWDQLPPGRIDGSQLVELVRNHSVTLKRLYQASVDFGTITKFGEAELAFAKEIGDDFRTFKRYWTRLKKILADERPFRIAQAWEAKGAIGFFGLLLRHGYASQCGAELKRGDAAPQLLDFASLLTELKRAPLVDTDRLNLTYAIDRRHHGFLTGGWFEAYSYLVFDDMLTRLAADFEIYSRVQYQATQAGKSASRGEIDLLVSLQDQIVMVECKSGDFSDDEVTRYLQKKRFLKEIFDGMGVRETLFMLVAPRVDADETGATADRLQADGVELVEPQDIRTLLSKRLMART